MRIFLSLALFLALAVPAPAHGGEAPRRSLFVSVIQEPPVLASREAIGELVAFAKKAGVEALFVQVYFANRAWFRSASADDAPYDACAALVGEDPLALLVRQAHGSGIQVHAWLNLLSLGANGEASLLKKYGPGILTRNRDAKRSLEDYSIDGQYFLEPGDPRVGAELSAVIGEVLAACPELDGVQFDYIRYPDMRPAYGHTEANVARFREATGRRKAEECDAAWQDWKRSQVTQLVESLAAEARRLRPGIAVSTTGCMPYQRALYEAFQDWPGWLDRQTVDFVTVMSYSPYTDIFERWIGRAMKETKSPGKIVIGLGAYRLGGSPGVFEREFRFSEASGCGGVAIFHYGSLVGDPALASIASAPAPRLRAADADKER